MGLGKKREAKAQEKFERRKIASGKAAEVDKAAKDALVQKMKGGGKLTRKELKLAERMDEGEGKDNDG